MAIQGIGGAKAYVITGTVSPQSSAQYWSNLVSQQKYKLWEQAQNIALQEMKQQGATDQMLIEAYQSKRQDLLKEIEGLKELDRKYQLEEVKSSQKIKEQKAKFESGIGGGQGARGGAAGRVVKKKTDDQIIQELKDNANDDYLAKDRSLTASRNRKQKLEGEKAKLSKGGGIQTNATRIGQIDEEIEILNTEIVDKVTIRNTAKANADSYNTMSPEAKAKKAAQYRPEYERIGYIAPDKGTTKEKEYVEPEPLNLQSQREQLARDIQARQAELQALEMPQVNQFDLLGRTRQIAGEEFGLRPSQRRSGRELVRSYLRGEPTRQPGEVERFIEDSGFTTERGFPQQQPQPQAPSMSLERRRELEALGVSEDWLNENIAPAREGVIPLSLEETVNADTEEGRQELERRSKREEDLREEGRLRNEPPLTDYTPAGKIYKERAFGADLENTDQETITPRQIDDLYALGELYVEDYDLSGEVFPSAPTKRRATYDEYLAKRQDAMSKLASTEESAQKKNVALRPEPGRITAQQLEEQKVREYAPMLTESYPEQFREFGNEPGQAPYPERLSDVYASSGQASARRKAEEERSLFAEQMLLTPQARIPSEPPTLENQRAAEFEVLGIEELLQPVSETKPTTLPPQVKYKTERIAASRKLLKDPPQFGEEKPEWAEIVEKLYDPKTGDQEDLANAWAEITKTYKEDRDTMIKAHDYLLYIDRANDAAQKPE